MLDHKGVVLLLVAATVAGTAYIARAIPTEFIPREDQGLFHVELSLTQGSRLELTDRVAKRVGEIIGEVGGDDVAGVYARAGVDPARLANIGDPTGPNRATLSVALAPETRRSLPQLVEVVDAQLAQIPALDVQYQLHETALEGVLGERTAPVQVEIIGDEVEVLRRLCADLAARLEELPSVYNVTSNFQGGQPEIDLRLREDAVVASGLTVATIVQALERRLSGEVIGELSKDQRARDIRVGFERLGLRELPQLRIDAPDGAILALGDLSDPILVEGPREILRREPAPARAGGRLSGRRRGVGRGHRAGRANRRRDENCPMATGSKLAARSASGRSPLPTCSSRCCSRWCWCTW